MSKSDVRKKLEELAARETFVTLHGEFYRAALDNLVEAIEIQKRLDGNCDAPALCIDEEFHKGARQYRAIMGCIVFSAMAVEALINVYGMTRIGKTHYKNWYDSLPTPLKWQFVPKQAVGASLDPRCEPFQGLEKLVQKRNELVHHKPESRTNNELYKEWPRVASLEDARDAAVTVHRLVVWLEGNDSGFNAGTVVVPSDFYEEAYLREAYGCVIGESPE